MTEVKICGITNLQDALAAAECGAVALGFIFYPPSPRYVKPEDAKIIINSLPEKVVKIGVFVNEKPEEIKRIMEYCSLDMIQLHGDESAEYCTQFPAAIIIKAFELKNDDDVSRALKYNVAAILIDSRHAGLYGGTGKTSNWELARCIKDEKPLILSGGLNAGNLTEALKTIAPAALDINSGVEASPGIKDHKKLTQIFEIIRSADTTPVNSPLIFKKRKT
ncbi:phosphoribosylanthranilate isomerase [hydrocarbon metagenome]|uniref:phosphoribosylanthranilate isomerase n=1 Tax=hydrocarbon metagenome TaxID=938273 RepID=A0A0W8FUQ6_9ZZZZ